MPVLDVKRQVKKSYAIHSTFKLMRQALDVPPKKWLQLQRMAAVLRVLPNTMLPVPRLLDVYDAVATLNRERLNGDIVECGVWNGGCIGLMAIANSGPAGLKRKFHLFDSFEGLPQPSPQDVDVLADFRSQYPEAALNKSQGGELFAIGACVGNSQPAVEKFLVDRLRLHAADLVFHKGWFQDTVPGSIRSIERIALLRVDGDWYDSTRTCLDGLFDKVVNGGFVVIDDYGTFSGCRQATDEFFRRRNIAPKLTYSDSECVFFRIRR